MVWGRGREGEARGSPKFDLGPLLKFFRRLEPLSKSMPLIIESENILLYFYFNLILYLLKSLKLGILRINL
jgi:hypothetical protein